MKKSIFLFVLAFGFATTMVAQGAHFGFKAGVNLANLNGGDTSLDSRTGFHVGLVAELRASDKFGVQPEVIYSSQGAKLGSADLKVDYLNVPVLADIKLVKMLSLHLGPQFGFVIDEGDLTDPKSFDLSGAAGLELKITKFFAQARYNFGITDIADADGSPKNAVFQLSIGFNFF